MKYTDLLGTSYEQMNCGEVAAEGLRRLGLEEAAAALPTDQTSAARLAARAYGEWLFVSHDVGQAQVGDVIVSDGPDDGLHVSLVITPKRALTSARKCGVYAPPVNRITAVRGVHRFTP